MAVALATQVGPARADGVPVVPHGFYGGPLTPRPTPQRPGGPGGARVFGPDGFQLQPVDPSGHMGSSGEASAPTRAPAPLTPEQKAEALKRALEPKPTAAAQRQTTLDSLFKRLAATDDPDLARAIAGAIDRVWLRSDSATATLLMDRAVGAIGAGQLPLAQQILDKLVVLEPDWAEVWNKRATARFLAGDFDGSMADIDQVLKREPRHYGALTGMAAILRHTGFNAEALAVFRKVLALYPAQPDLSAQVEKLRTDVEGRDL